MNLMSAVCMPHPHHFMSAHHTMVCCVPAMKIFAILYRINSIFSHFSQCIPPLPSFSSLLLLPLPYCLLPQHLFLLAVLGMKSRSFWIGDKNPTPEPYPIFVVSVEKITPETSSLFFHCLL